MGAELGRDQTPLILAIATVGLIPLIASVLERWGVESSLAATTATAASPSLTSAVTLSWIRVKEKRESRDKRFDEAREGALRGSALPTILAVGLVAGALVSMVQALLIIPIDRTINVGLEQGAIGVASDRIGELLRYLDSFLILIWFPVTVVMTTALGTFAYHRVGSGPGVKLTAVVLVGGLMVLAISAAFNYSVGRSFDSILTSLPDLVQEAALASVAMATGLGIGSVRARKTRNAFLIGRLLEDVSEPDRQAVIDLLRSSQTESGEGVPRPAEAGPSTT